MSKIGWFVIGITLGAVAANQLRDNPAAREWADDVTDSAKEFGSAVAEGFREREAEISRTAKK